MATREAIRDVGLPAVTARGIAGRASANLASIPYHFGSKDELVAEALVAEVQVLVRPVLALLGSDRSPAERATEMVSILNDLFDNAQTAVPGYLAALAAAPHSPGVRDGLTGLWQDVRARLAGDIAEQVSARLLPDWVAPPAMAGLILAVVQGVIVASAVDSDGPGHREIAGQFLFLLLTAGASVSTEGEGVGRR